MRECLQYNKSPSTSNSLSNFSGVHGGRPHTSKIAIFLRSPSGASPDRKQPPRPIILPPPRWREKWGRIRNLLCQAAFCRGLFEYCYVTVMHVRGCVYACAVCVTTAQARTCVYICMQVSLGVGCVTRPRENRSNPITSGRAKQLRDLRQSINPRVFQGKRLQPRELDVKAGESHPLKPLRCVRIFGERRSPTPRSYRFRSLSLLIYRRFDAFSGSHPGKTRVFLKCCERWRRGPGVVRSACDAFASQEDSCARYWTCLGGMNRERRWNGLPS